MPRHYFFIFFAQCCVLTLRAISPLMPFAMVIIAFVSAPLYAMPFAMPLGLRATFIMLNAHNVVKNYNVFACFCHTPFFVIVIFISPLDCFRGLLIDIRCCRYADAITSEYRQQFASLLILLIFSMDHFFFSLPYFSCWRFHAATLLPLIIAASPLLFHCFHIVVMTAAIIAAADDFAADIFRHAATISLMPFRCRY